MTDTGRVWAALMVAAHVIVICKSYQDRDPGSVIQACVGVSGYIITLSMSVLTPAAYLRYTWVPCTAEGLRYI